MTDFPPDYYVNQLRALFAEREQIDIRRERYDSEAKAAQAAMWHFQDAGTKAAAEHSEVLAKIGKLKHAMDLAGIAYPQPTEPKESP